MLRFLRCVELVKEMMGEQGRGSAGCCPHPNPLPMAEGANIKKGNLRCLLRFISRYACT